MISLIQLTFYCMIPLGTVSWMFQGLYGMVFVSGINLDLPGFTQGEISYHYSNLKFKSNFISNFNLMLAPIILCPIISLILRLAFVRSKSYKYKPRFKKYSMAFLCEWFFTLTIFSTMNIFISLVINVQSLGFSDPISLTISLFMAAIPGVAIFLYARFTGKY